VHGRAAVEAASRLSKSTRDRSGKFASAYCGEHSIEIEASERFAGPAQCRLNGITAALAIS
jgi:hypothetical protein